MFVVLLSCVSAITYKTNTAIELRHESNATACNISIAYPNSTLLTTNQIMTMTTGYGNYSISATNVTGEYEYFGECDGISFSGQFQITKTGVPISEESSTQSLTRGIYFVGMIAVLMFLGFLYYKGLNAINWSFFVLFLLFCSIGLNLAVISLDTYGDSTYNVLDQLGAVSYYFVWILGGMLISIWVLKTIAYLAERHMMKRAAAVGEPLDFDKQY